MITTPASEEKICDDFDIKWLDFCRAIYPNDITARSKLYTSQITKDIFRKSSKNGSSEIKSLSELRGPIPTIIIGDEFVGVSPMVGPTPETLEFIKQMKDESK
jgi:hypothetical protein